MRLVDRFWPAAPHCNAKTTYAKLELLGDICSMLIGRGGISRGEGAPLRCPLSVAAPAAGTMAFLQHQAIQMADSVETGGFLCMISNIIAAEVAARQEQHPYA